MAERRSGEMLGRLQSASETLARVVGMDEKLDAGHGEKPVHLGRTMGMECSGGSWTAISAASGSG